MLRVSSLVTIQVPEIIDPVFAKTSPKRSFVMTENERFGLVFVKTGSINSDKGYLDEESCGSTDDTTAGIISIISNPKFVPIIDSPLGWTINKIRGIHR